MSGLYSGMPEVWTERVKWEFVKEMSNASVLEDYVHHCFDFRIERSRAASTLQLSNPDGGEVRALVIGIDDYQHVRKLKGATADAHDVDSSLRTMGVGDVTALINDRADRSNVLREISALVERTKTNDIVFLAIAGHGAQEPERIKGSQPDGMEDV